MQRVKGSKGQNVIEFHSRLGHLKNISHLSLFPEEGPSCCIKSVSLNCTVSLFPQFAVREVSLATS